MKYMEDLSAALVAAESELEHLDVTALMVVAEIGDYGIQIAISDHTDPLVVRHALRGAANRLDGLDTPILGEIIALLRARGWEVAGDGNFKHPKAPDPQTLTNALMTQSLLELAHTGVVEEGVVDE